MNKIARNTIGAGFLLLKISVFLFISFAVMAFLSEIAHRMRMRLPQPFKGVAVVAIAVTSALPFTRVVNGVKVKLLEVDNTPEPDEVIPKPEANEVQQLLKGIGHAVKKE